ncbi:5fe18a81-1bc4-4c1c-acda-f2fb3b3763d5 [Sclerotinia trifoliorum]|uniref:5fe18a81-1bc4-4c1c-acda-f2fb3b3763d5 n=1 Tax=Sclerotinia trifoliorum TaxID=28548 RepID=A0A8H2VN74_9HELO|nr:5fe18a81-1bc4-4c1c-acda-f2fb3b3763d5 [Sclerotinia trifoliorum]
MILCLTVQLNISAHLHVKRQLNTHSYSFRFPINRCHYSMASLENIRAVSTFCDNADGRYRGILIHYHNDDQQVLGQYRHDLTQEDFAISLYGLHWQQFRVAHTSNYRTKKAEGNEDEAPGGLTRSFGVNGLPSS